MSWLYIALTAVNQGISKLNKVEFSKLEKITIGASIIAGIDVSITPMFTHGQTLHDYLGITPKESVNTILKISELAGAYAGLIYQGWKNNSPSRKGTAENTNYFDYSK